MWSFRCSRRSASARSPRRGLLVPVAGIRLRSELHREYLDVFFALDPIYDRVRDRAVTVAYGNDGEELPFFTAEDIVLFKLSFNRPKDWVDIQSVLRNGPDLDDSYIEEVLVEMRGPTMYPRIAKLRAMIATMGPAVGSGSYQGRTRRWGMGRVHQRPDHRQRGRSPDGTGRPRAG